MIDGVCLRFARTRFGQRGETDGVGVEELLPLRKEAAEGRRRRGKRRRRVAGVVREGSREGVEERIQLAEVHGFHEVNIALIVALVNVSANFYFLISIFISIDDACAKNKS